MNKDILHDIIDEENFVELSSPVNQNLNILRPSIFPNLLNSFEEISKTSPENISIFEVGPIYIKNDIFNKVITGIRGGKKILRNCHIKLQNDLYSFFDIKGDFILAIKHYNITEDDLSFIRLDEYESDCKINNNFFHPGKAAAVFQNGKKNQPIGYCGEIHPGILKKFNLTEKGPIIGFVLFHTILEKKELKPLFLSQYQAISRDFSLIFNDSIKISEIKNIIYNSNHNNLLQEINFFDIYQNDDLKSLGKKSVAFNIKLQSDKKTLNDKEIMFAVDNILNDIKKNLGGIFSFDAG